MGDIIVSIITFIMGIVTGVLVMDSIDYIKIRRDKKKLDMIDYLNKETAWDKAKEDESK